MCLCASMCTHSCMHMPSCVQLEMPKLHCFTMDLGPKLPNPDEVSDGCGMYYTQVSTMPMLHPDEHNSSVSAPYSLCHTACLFIISRHGKHHKGFYVSHKFKSVFFFICVVFACMCKSISVFIGNIHGNICFLAHCSRSE